MGIDYPKMTEAERKKLDGTPWQYAGDKMTDLTRDAIFVRKIEVSKPAKPRGVPNQLEADFAAHVTGVACAFEANTFYLSLAVTYKPDFTIYCIGSYLGFVEVKLDTSGMTRQAKSRLATQNRESLTKLKLCAQAWPNLK